MHDLNTSRQQGRRGENVLIVGSGGREHALAWKIAQSKLANEVYVAPGNGGTGRLSIPISATDLAGLADFAGKHDCFTIVGPELPLSLGIVDHFEELGLPIFGPTRKQALLESSKSYAKEFMRKNSIPTTSFEAFEDKARALDYASRYAGNVAVKADGLAAGKGVFVCSTMDEADRAITAILEENAFGDAGRSIVVEEKLEGREVSLMTLCDGFGAVPFGTATDHKRLLDDDLGPNTGGMGAYSPSPDLDENMVEDIMRRIILPTVSRTGYRGFLYAGLMLTRDGVKVLEFNARLGDPETQCILPRLESDILPILLKACDDAGGGSGALDWIAEDLSWSDNYCCTVAMCAAGYPNHPRLGDEIFGLESLSELSTTAPCHVFHSGTRREGEKLVTSGGRVVYVTSMGATLSEAARNSYAGVGKISWKGEYHRTDIGIQSVKGEDSTSFFPAPKANLSATGS